MHCILLLVYLGDDNTYVDSSIRETSSGLRVAENSRISIKTQDEKYRQDPNCVYAVKSSIELTVLILQLGVLACLYGRIDHRYIGTWLFTHVVSVGNVEW